MKKLLLFAILTAHYGVSQIVTANSQFPNGDTELTIIFDLKLAKDARAKGLLGKTDDVYLWSGAGIDAAGDAFKYQPTGQTTFSKPFDPGKMKSDGNDKWSIKLVPRKYYGVPANEIIKKLGLLLKNGDGTSQTEDITLTLYDNKLSININSPKVKVSVLNKTDAIKVSAIFSKKSDAIVTANYKNTSGDAVSKEIANLKQVDSLKTEIGLDKLIGLPEGALIDVKISAKSDLETADETVSFIVKPTVPVAELPAGTLDGVNYTSESSVILSFFAPKKSFVYLLGDFNNYTPSAEYLMNKTANSDRFWLELKGLTAGKEYTYQYLIDGGQQFADPYAEKVLDSKNDKFLKDFEKLPIYPTKGVGIVSVLQAGKPKYNWQITDFKRPKNSDLIIYELLIRDFTVEGNYKAALEKLPYLKKLGINAIELMPIQEFTGNDSWGYNPTFYLAPDKAYGLDTDLKKFIDECHKTGIAVILDMVMNQADDEFPYVKMYFDGSLTAPDSPFFNQSATHPFSVFRDFNHESKATQDLVDRVNNYWLNEYKIDGYRFDLSKGFTQKQNTDVGAWSNYDGSRIAIWKRIYDQIRKVDKSAYVILEHFAANNEEQELSDYGMMFWANGNGDNRNAMKGNSANLASVSHRNRGFKDPNLVGYMESHDEERLIFEAITNGNTTGNYSVKTLTNALERAKAQVALFLPIEGPKMIWQFGELGYDISINQGGRTSKKPVKWEYFDEPARKNLYKTYGELIKFRTGLNETSNLAYAYEMTGKFRQTKIQNNEINIMILANLDTETRTEKPIFTKTGQWFDYFSNESFTIDNADNLIELKPGEFHIYTTKKLPEVEKGLVPWSAYSKGQILANEPFLNNNISLFPNPVSNVLQLDLGIEKINNVNIKIWDEIGNLVNDSFEKSDRNGSVAINVNNYKPGIYIVEYYGNEVSFGRKKFLKK